MASLSLDELNKLRTLQESLSDLIDLYEKQQEELPKTDDINNVIDTIENSTTTISNKIDNINIDTTTLAKEQTLQTFIQNAGIAFEGLEGNQIAIMEQGAKQGTNENATNTAILEAVTTTPTLIEVTSAEITDMIERITE